MAALHRLVPWLVSRAGGLSRWLAGRGNRWLGRAGEGWLWHEAWQPPQKNPPNTLAGRAGYFAGWRVMCWRASLLVASGLCAGREAGYVLGWLGNR